MFDCFADIDDAETQNLLTFSPHFVYLKFFKVIFFIFPSCINTELFKCSLIHTHNRRQNENLEGG